MKKFISLALVSALTVVCFTSCTLHITSNNPKYRRSSEYDYSSSIFSSDNVSSSGVSSSYGEKVSESDIKMKDSSERRPLKVGDWGKAMCYTGKSPEYSSVGVTVTELIRGDEAKQMILDAGYSENDLRRNLKSGNEWAVLKYKIYCPEDFPVGFSGLYCRYLTVHPIYYSGNYKYTYMGADISHYDVDDYKAKYIQAGEVDERLCAFSVGKDVKDVYVKFGENPNSSDEEGEWYSWFIIQ